jgi:hypothetical protein
MTNLDAFDLHMTNTLEGPPTGYEKIFAAIANEVKLPLTQVFLRGLPASEDSLLKFIDNHPKINHLDIREMQLTSGKWTRVIQRLCQMPALSRLSLSNLYGEHNIFNCMSDPSIKFGRLTLTCSRLVLSKTDDKDTKSQYTKMGCAYACVGGTKVHTREFDRETLESLRGGLDFVDADIGPPLGTIQLHQWLNKRQFQYTL